MITNINLNTSLSDHSSYLQINFAFNDLHFFVNMALLSQTGSGKTFTISGIKEDPYQRGIVQRSFQYIFDNIEKVI